MPIVLLTWILVIFSLFHFHDKTIIAGAAYESAIVGAELWNDEEENKTLKIERYFQERIRGKLLFYQTVNSEIFLEKTKVRVTAFATRNMMNINVEQQAAITVPEQEIIKWQHWKENVEGTIE